MAMTVFLLSLGGAPPTVGLWAKFAIIQAALGRAYEDGGAWITGLGAALFFVLIVLLTHWIRREADRHEATEG
jgi:NADH:ubiquinone oxidoreductase subunit 2 (subunit N)